MPVSRNRARKEKKLRKERRIRFESKFVEDEAQGAFKHFRLLRHAADHISRMDTSLELKNRIMSRLRELCNTFPDRIMCRGPENLPL